MFRRGLGLRGAGLPWLSGIRNRESRCVFPKSDVFEFDVLVLQKLDEFGSSGIDPAFATSAGAFLNIGPNQAVVGKGGKNVYPSSRY